MSTLSHENTLAFLLILGIALWVLRGPIAIYHEDQNRGALLYERARWARTAFSICSHAALLTLAIAALSLVLNVIRFAKGG